MNGTRYLKTAKIGRGGSSEVFRVVGPDGQVSCEICFWSAASVLSLVLRLALCLVLIRFWGVCFVLGSFFFV